jgi:hypothetical protein
VARVRGASPIICPSSSGPTAGSLFLSSCEPVQQDDEPRDQQDTAAHDEDARVFSHDPQS